jgi:hypothetical protein
MPKAATISRALAQSFSQRAPEVPEERGDSLKSPGANRPCEAIAVKVKFGRTTARLLEYCFSTSAGKKGVHCFGCLWLCFLVSLDPRTPGLSKAEMGLKCCSDSWPSSGRRKRLFRFPCPPETATTESKKGRLQLLPVLRPRILQENEHEGRGRGQIFQVRERLVETSLSRSVSSAIAEAQMAGCLRAGSSPPRWAYRCEV